MAGGLGTLRLQVKYHKYVADTDSATKCTENPLEPNNADSGPMYKLNTLQNRHNASIEEAESSATCSVFFVIKYFTSQII